MKIEMSRDHLESLSFSDLSTLADEYGVDVPENLDRRFLIAELLELLEEDIDEHEDEMIISEDDVIVHEETSLQKNYNETQVSCVLRNPYWLFVFWNISEADQIMLRKIPDHVLMIRVCCLSNPKDPMPEEAFEIQAISKNQEQYILLPTGKNYIKIELVYVTANTGKVLAFSPVISIPQGSPFVSDLQIGRDSNTSEILKLSGMNKILTEQYKNHRHSVS